MRSIADSISVLPSKEGRACSLVEGARVVMADGADPLALPESLTRLVVGLETVDLRVEQISESVSEVVERRVA